MTDVPLYDDDMGAAEHIQGAPDITQGAAAEAILPTAEPEPAPAADDPREKAAADVFGRAVRSGIKNATGEDPGDVVTDATTEAARLVLDLSRALGGGLWARFALIGTALGFIAGPPLWMAYTTWKEAEGAS